MEEHLPSRTQEDHRDVSLNIRSPGRNLNPRSPAHKARALTSRQGPLVQRVGSVAACIWHRADVSGLLRRFEICPSRVAWHSTWWQQHRGVIRQLSVGFSDGVKHFLLTVIWNSEMLYQYCFSALLQYSRIGLSRETKRSWKRIRRFNFWSMLMILIYWRKFHKVHAVAPLKFF
jgi:hypothetical protein